MALVHYGFSREEVYWMPIGELEDYILLLNQQQEEEQEASQQNSSPKEAPKTFGEVFRNMKNPLRK